MQLTKQINEEARVSLYTCVYIQYEEDSEKLLKVKVDFSQEKIMFNPTRYMLSGFQQQTHVHYKFKKGL